MYARITARTLLVTAIFFAAFCIMPGSAYHRVLAEESKAEVCPQDLDNLSPEELAEIAKGDDDRAATAAKQLVDLWAAGKIADKDAPALLASLIEFGVYTREQYKADLPVVMITTQALMYNFDQIKWKSKSTITANGKIQYLGISASRGKSKVTLRVNLDSKIGPLETGKHEITVNATITLTHPQQPTKPVEIKFEEKRTFQIDYRFPTNVITTIVDEKIHAEVAKAITVGKPTDHVMILPFNAIPVAIKYTGTIPIDLAYEIWFSVGNDSTLYKSDLTFTQLKGSDYVGSHTQGLERDSLKGIAKPGDVLTFYLVPSWLEAYKNPQISSYLAGTIQAGTITVPALINEDE